MNKYPELSEDGQNQAQALIDTFKIEMRKAADEILGQLYINIIPHIESDAWTNYRNDIMSGFRGYDKCHNEHNFKAIRAEIFKEHREEIIKDLDQDNLAKIKELEEQLAWWKKMKGQDY